MPRIFVTGGTGFLGSYLLRYLVAQKAGKIIALKRSKSNMTLVEDIADQVEWIEGDVLDTVSLEEGMEGVDQVYHCAALVSFDPKMRKRMNRVNVEGTANVVNIALDFGIKKLVHISSIAAIGRSKEKQQISEDTKWERNPLNTNYALSKHLAEQEVWRGIAEGLPAAILNPSIIIGSGFWDSGSARFFQQVTDGLRFYTTGTTGFVDVRDVARMSIELMDSDIVAQRFIVNGENLTYRQLFSEIAEVLQQKPPSIEATSWMRSLVWRLDWLKSKFTGKTRFITKEIAAHVARTYFYRNQKSIDTFHFNYTPITQTIKETGKQFLEAQTQSKEASTLPL